MNDTVSLLRLNPTGFFSQTVMPGGSFPAPGIIEVLSMNFGGESQHFKINLKLSLITAILYTEKRIKSKVLESY